MRTVSDLIVQSKKTETPGVVVISVFLLFVAAVMAVPLGMVWAASTL
jgi:hypothetical protein